MDELAAIRAAREAGRNPLPKDETKYTILERLSAKLAVRIGELRQRLYDAKRQSPD